MLHRILDNYVTSLLFLLYFGVLPAGVHGCLTRVSIGEKYAFPIVMDAFRHSPAGCH